MPNPVRVILITDGDKVARRALEWVAANLGLRCISASAGNPTPLTGPELVALIRQVPYDPVLVMVDDKGNPGQGPGEAALAYICQSGDVRVLGAIAVASNTFRARGTPVDHSVTRDARVVDQPVDKYGRPDSHRAVLLGDTVDVLRDLEIPVIIGIGDPGKMEGADSAERGFEVTRRAVLEILGSAGISVPPHASPESSLPESPFPER